MERVKKIKEVNLEEKRALLLRINDLLDDYEKQKEDIFREIESLRFSNLEEYLSVSLLTDALTKKIKEIDENIKKLLIKKQELSDELLDIMRDIKSIEIVESLRKKEKLRKESFLEELNAAFFFLAKNFYILFFILLFHSIAFSQPKAQDRPALYNNLEKSEESSINKAKESISSKLDQKIKELEKEKQELQKLLKEKEKIAKEIEEEKKQKQEKKKKEKELFEKYVQVVSKADSDQAGQILNEVDPKIAAKILTSLPPMQAGDILSAMDPKKAALVTEYIMGQKITQKANKNTQQLRNQSTPSKPPS